MVTISVKDRTQIYYNDWGSGQPVVFSHGWPPSAEAFEDQMCFPASRGYRCIAPNRRGHGRSSQPWNGNGFDTCADDLAAVVEALDLRNAIHVGHSTGGGEVARYIGRHGTGRVAKAVLIGAIPPLMLKTPADPSGTPIEAFNQIRDAVQADRPQFWRQGMMTGFPASWFCIKAFSGTDLTDDLARFDAPTVIVHDDDDQVVPVGAPAMISSDPTKGATLETHEGAPHGLATTLKDRINAELLAILKS